MLRAHPCSIDKIITNCRLKLETTMKLSFLLFAGFLFTTAVFLFTTAVFLFTTSAGAVDGKLALKNYLYQGDSKGVEGKPKRTDPDFQLREAVKAWIAFPTAAAIKYGPINSWDTKLVTDMSSLFSLARAFNEDISSWNTAAVTNMGEMFYGASSFNQDLSKWNVEAVTDMWATFNRAVAFNQDLSSWNTGAVTNMRSMFSETSAFNQDLSNWNTGSVIHMAYMFREASAFNQDLSKWDVTAVTDMRGMFWTARSFNQQICWSLKQGADTTDMFRDCKGSFRLDCEKEEKEE
jgi:surface protein